MFIGQSCLSRRSFMWVGGAAGLGISSALQSAARAGETPMAKNVVMIFLTGGPATIDFWDMKPEAPERVRGEFRPVESSVPGIQICEHMPHLARAMHLATLVRSVTHSIAEHTQGASYLMTGNRPNPASEHASLGSLSAKLLDNEAETPPYMAIGDVPSSGAGDLGAVYNPFAVAATGTNGLASAERIGLPEGFTVSDLQRREKVLARLDRQRAAFDQADLPKQLDRYQRQAFDILRSDRINKALNLDEEKPELRERYGNSGFGRGTLAARRLLEAGARFVTIGLGDWDTHNNNFTRLRNTLLPQLDRGLAALLTDLDERGLLHETLIYCTGEFGRTPAVNGGAGRDHWAHSMTALVAGGMFRRGAVYGATDSSGGDPVEDACSPDDVSASLFAQLGFPPTQQVLDRTGRPISLFRNGRVLPGLVS
jgi:hypothetical protein